MISICSTVFFATVMWSSAHCGTAWRSCSLGQAAAAPPAPPTPAPRPVLVTASGHAVSPLVLCLATFHPLYSLLYEYIIFIAIVTPFLHYYTVQSAHSLLSMFSAVYYRQFEIFSEPALFAQFCFPSLMLLSLFPQSFLQI